MDPQTPTPLKTEPTSHFPALLLAPRSSHCSSSAEIPVYSLFALPKAESTPLSLPEMAGKVAKSSSSEARQPPRPPNAWIMYRSDKMKALPPIQPGEPRRVQADVSKMISNMWKGETEEVKLEYERRSEARKQQHLLQFPGYRYAPQKKEEKERLKALKKAEKEAGRRRKSEGPSSASTSSTPLPPQQLPIPTLPYPLVPTHYPSVYQQHARFGPGGPSPPLSAASSPEADGQPAPPQNISNDQWQSIDASHIAPNHVSGSSRSTSVSALPTPAYSVNGSPLSASPFRTQPPLLPPSQSGPSIYQSQSQHHTMETSQSWAGLDVPQNVPQVHSSNQTVSHFVDRLL